MSATKPQAETTAGTACWHCGAARQEIRRAGAHFCESCGRIQPLDPRVGYFAFFGWPSKLQIDPAELENKFHQLSWKLHPDNFVKAAEYERNLALERSSELNDAYRTLRDPISRVEYLLLRAGVRKEGATKQQAPPELLEEVFELNESLDELREAKSEGLPAEAAGDLTELREKLETARRNFQEKLDEVDAALEAAFGEWDAAQAHPEEQASSNRVMIKMNDLLNRRSYIRNLVRNVRSELGD